MLAKRIIATLLIRDGMLVKGKHFDNWRVVGSPMQAINVYNRRQMDEIVVFFLERPDWGLLRSLCHRNFIPLTSGGDIQGVADAERYFDSGADKIALGSTAMDIPGLVEDCAQRWGSNAVVGVFNDPEPDEVFEAVERGIGEAIVQSVPRDGEMNGFDLETIKRLRGVPVPLVASSGAGDPSHWGESFSEGCDGATAASLWHFTQTTPMEVKEWLDKRGYPVRLT